MTDLFAHDDHQRLTGFYAALISHCEAEITLMRTGFQLELRRIKSPDAQAAYQGNYTDNDCWMSYASDDFIRVVNNLSALCGTEIGAATLLLDNPINKVLTEKIIP